VHRNALKIVSIGQYQIGVKLQTTFSKTSKDADYLLPGK
jgi:hypothetical protein